MLQAHPYEEAAYDILSFGKNRADIQLGRVGQLEGKLSLRTSVMMSKGNWN